MSRFFRSPLVISVPDFPDRELETLQALQDSGAERIHIRKPDCSDEQLRNFLQRMVRYCDPAQMSLHHHPQLAVEFGFSGIHVRNELLEQVSRNHPEKWISVPCHTWQEVTGAAAASYVLLSPVFDSISKQGYTSGFPPEEIPEKLQCGKRPPVVALGGISEKNIALVRKSGFEGAALLGAVWEKDRNRINPVKTVRNYRKIAEIWNGYLK